MVYLFRVIEYFNMNRGIKHSYYSQHLISSCLAPEIILKEYEVFANICQGGSANVYAAKRQCDGVPVRKLNYNEDKKTDLNEDFKLVICHL